jgi:ketosteroid isomerase-like protein
MLDAAAARRKRAACVTKAGPRRGTAGIVSSFRARFLDAGKPRQALRAEETSVRFLSPDSALMTGRYVLSGGGAPDSTGWFTLVWLRTDDAWKVVHDHSS